MLDNNDKQEEDEMIPFFNIASTDFDKDLIRYSSSGKKENKGSSETSWSGYYYLFIY
jgi:hypothetical protein